MTYPWDLPVTLVLRVKSLTPDGHGGTKVVCEFDGNTMREFFLNRDVSVVGADTIRGDIISNARTILGMSLEVSE